MTIISNLGTFEFIVFKTITSLIIVVSSIFIFLKTRKLYNLSFQKGIKHFSNAFLIYSICFSIAYFGSLLLYLNSIGTISLITQFPMIMLLFSFFGLYTGAIGGFYLVYSLSWRFFEKDCLKKTKCSYTPYFLHVIALIIAVIEILLFIVYGNKISYLFYIIMICSIFLGIILNYKYFQKNNGVKFWKISDPFLSCAVLALGTYIGFFIESLVTPYISTIHYFFWGMVSVFFHAVYHNVQKITNKL